MHGKTIVVTGGLGRQEAPSRRRRQSVEPRSHCLTTRRPSPRASRTGWSARSSSAASIRRRSRRPRRRWASIKAKFGRLDALLNIAGGFQWDTIADGKVESWDRMYAMNLKTALNACKAALPYLLASGAGRIVNVGAGSALHAASGMGPYAASKSAVHRLTESLADELKLKGVTVNAVLPSIIDTAQNRRDMPKADFSRWVAPADLAAVMLFLASDEAKAVTGALIPRAAKSSPGSAGRLPHDIAPPAARLGRRQRGTA